MTTDIAKKLAAALRDATDNSEWQDALLEIADDLEGKYDKPAEHWIGPFEWRGGECPLPPGTYVEKQEPGEPTFRGRACDLEWGEPSTFRYRADNPEGWVARPADWFVPQGCDLQYEGGCQWGNRIEPAAPGEIASHIRLLPRRAATPEPAPIPADAQAVVREALEVCMKAFRGLAYQRTASAKALAALDALDAAPAEPQSFGYIAMNHGCVLTKRPFSSAEIARAEHPEALRIVKLVEEPDQ